MTNQNIAVIVSPWESSSTGVVSLWNMLTFKAATFCSLFSCIAHVEAAAKDSEIKDLDSEKRTGLVGGLGVIAKECEGLELENSCAYLSRMHRRLENQSPLPADELREMFVQLRERIEDELGTQLVMQIPKEKAKYYRQDKPLFGEQVATSFPSALDDIGHAGKCYACGRNTAAVFHLMRVMEVGLRSLGKSLQDDRVDPKSNPTWEKILHRCDEELAKPYNKRTAEWSSDNGFFSQATANLRAVKDAWRNSTMHVESTYDEEQALVVMNAVRGFMRHLATKLHE